ncbi:hypothetical protein CEXT_712981 [Caerostris extrusa]|uniref:Uncharacterized protein n=1 Tax=Caerostris extrusa TaxID=172846 RepID=A0AAV4TBK6_CAEEX|nr:hypothetical protein CEXT_712981 [Caerostris extrusa]
MCSLRVPRRTPLCSFPHPHTPSSTPLRIQDRLPARKGFTMCHLPDIRRWHFRVMLIISIFSGVKSRRPKGEKVQLSCEERC